MTSVSQVVFRLLLKLQVIDKQLFVKTSSPPPSKGGALRALKWSNLFIKLEIFLSITY